MILPATVPSDLPEVKAENTTFLRLLGLLYAAPSIPPAGGTIIAEEIPRTPRTTSIQKGFCAKPTSSTKTAYEPMPVRNIILLPSRSDSWPNGSWKAPAARVVDAAIHEIWPCVMPSSRPMVAVTVDVAPVRKGFDPMAMVACITKETSCNVFLKHSGRLPSFRLMDCATDGCVSCRSRLSSDLGVLAPYGRTLYVTAPFFSLDEGLVLASLPEKGDPIS